VLRTFFLEQDSVRFTDANSQAKREQAKKAANDKRVTARFRELILELVQEDGMKGEFDVRAFMVGQDNEYLVLLRDLVIFSGAHDTNWWLDLLIGLTDLPPNPAVELNVYEALFTF